MERYPDLRYKYIRGLIDHEKYQRSKIYLKSAAECTSKAIVSLELATDPVKTATQAKRLEGIGSEIEKRLKIINCQPTVNKNPPKNGHYCSSAGALLAAMLMIGERIELSAENDRPILVSEDQLLDQASQICEEKFNARDLRRLGVAANIDAATCTAWWRMSVLISRDMIKKRSLKKQPVYELLPRGREVAIRLRDARGTVGHSQPIAPIADQNNRPLPPLPRLNGQNDIVGAPHIGQPTHRNTGYSNRKRPPSAALGSANSIFQPESVDGRNLQAEALYTNDTGADGLILLVDTQEWGGDRVGLGELIRLLKSRGITYFTKKLKVADYGWMLRRCGRQLQIPIIIERKRADDLARSMRDGRYIKQKEKMIEWKRRYAKEGIDASMKYLIEGTPEQYAVKCTDGCGAVVKCGFPTVKQVNDKITEIDMNPEFDLLKTEDIRATIDLLAVMTAELKHRAQAGDFNNLFALDFNNGKDICTKQKGNQDEQSSSVFIDLEEPATRNERHIYAGSRVGDDNRSRENVLEHTPIDDEFKAPLAQFHSSVPNLNFKKKSEKRVLAPGEIPATRGRYVPDGAASSATRGYISSDMHSIEKDKDAKTDYSGPPSNLQQKPRLNYHQEIKDIQAVLPYITNERAAEMIELYGCNVNQIICVLVDEGCSEPLTTPQTRKRWIDDRRFAVDPGVTLESHGTSDVKTNRNPKISSDNCPLDKNVICFESAAKRDPEWSPTHSEESPKKRMHYKPLKKVPYVAHSSSATPPRRKILKNAIRAVEKKKAPSTGDSDEDSELPDLVSPDVDLGPTRLTPKVPPANSELYQTSEELRNPSPTSEMSSGNYQSSKYAKQVSQVKDLVPYIDDKKIISMLEKHDGNIDLAASELFDNDSQELHESNLDRGGFVDLTM